MGHGHHHSSHSKHRSRKHGRDERSHDKKRSGHSSRGIHKDKSERIRKVETKIDEADFYRMNSEFSLWLRMAKKIHFDDLETPKAKKLFRDFVNSYNKGGLQKFFYDGSADDQLDAVGRARHSWNLEKKVSAGEELMIGETRGGQHNKVEIESLMHQMENEAEKRARRDPDAERSDTKKWRKQVGQDMEDHLLPPKPSSAFEKRMENRRMEAEKRREREASPEGPDDDYLMGGRAEDSFKRALAAERLRKQRRDTHMSHRMDKYKKNEDRTMQAFLSDIRARGGGRITIAPRAPP